MLLKIIKWLSLLTLCFILLVMVAIEGLYFYGLRALPQNTAPTSEIYSKLFLQTQWVALEGKEAGEIKMPSMFPLKFITSLIAIVFETDAQVIIELPIGTRLASQNARELLQRNKDQNVHKFWHLNNISIAIWIANHWTAQQALNNLLDRSYFGYGYYGIEAAAQGYYGKSQTNLNTYEAVLLIGILKGPSYYDPKCKNERALKRMNQIIRQLSVNWPADYETLKEVRELPQSLVFKKQSEC